MNTKSGRYPAYFCDPRLRKQPRGGSVTCTPMDTVGFKAIWAHLTQAELLLANAKAYYASLPSQGGTAKLEKELAMVTARMERTKRMVRIGTEDEDAGNAMILEDKKRIAEIQAELRAAGSVMALPSSHVIEAACRRIAESGAKLETGGVRDAGR